MNFYAHTKSLADGSPAQKELWEPLFTPFGNDINQCQRELCEHCRKLTPGHGHLNKVAYWTAKFAAEMFPADSPESASAHQWGYLTGLWHDLGKFAPKWQAYLYSKSDPHIAEMTGNVPHSTAGAQYSHANLPNFGTLLSYLIAGHHAGLANGIDSSESNLSNRLTKRASEQTPEFIPHVPTKILHFTESLPPLAFTLKSGTSLGFFLRILFSALVDADFLATESYMSPSIKNLRPQLKPSISDLETAFNIYLAQLSSSALATDVNRLRAEILHHCQQAAEDHPGLFSLTVPTGGGKTLSSLAFALKHARIHNLRRVIYVIPYTSIIEQNASVFRMALAALGPDVVLEHHSNLDPDSEDETTTNRLASENWDARLIVTTNVQFFESLHANRTSRCRKLHRIARSVIILDEAQSLPVEFLAPCLRSLEELHAHYQSTIVLCTATQPAIHRRPDFPIGLDSPREIIPDPSNLYDKLRRVHTSRLPGRTDNPTLIHHILQHPQSLTIVNTRRHARELFDLLPNDGTRFHLSALMCANHRSEVLEIIKKRLHENLPTRLISTQLIEAGVDIDFPVVFRSLAGLDSIAQAAGRCDREGHLTAANGKPSGKLFLFESAEHRSPAFIISATNATIQVLASNPADILALNNIQDYFQRHYWDQRDITDQKHILENYPRNLREPSDLFCFKFKTCARDFRLIDDYSEPILIPYGEKGRAICDQLRQTFDPTEIRRLARKLQRYTVAIPPQQHAELLRTGILIPLHDDSFHLLNSTPHYDEQFGLHPKPELELTPENSIL
ncbi:CRISPR-associated endonuclease Cas3'' [Luteolibacter algae]|uniref:CRISPR-associated endonuclease Cas3 n=1 Tax=Luteolibacter algae TaxID=454151 RepID=A0ABW5D7B3_9BACT